MRDRVKGVVARALDVSPAEIPDDAASEALPGWDSLKQLEVMLALELEFGVHIPAESMLELTSLPAISSYLEQHAAA